MEFNDRVFGVISVDMLFQRLLQYEGFGTVVAFEWALTAVDHRVALENLFLDERSMADVALERLFAGVHSDVAG